MGKIFTLTSDLISLAKDAFDDLINQLGKTCALVYPPKFTDCPNCILDSSGRSTNRYQSGGPIPFTDGICPYCHGQGKFEQTTEESITLLCEWNPKNFKFPIPNADIRRPQSLLQTKGFIKDYRKIQRADHLIYQSDLQELSRKKFKLLSDGGDVSNIVQAEYFIATWEQHGE